MEEGMTDKQFMAYIRLLLLSLENAVAEPTKEKQQEKLNHIMDMLRESLKD